MKTHLPCPKCNSSDAYSVYHDGGYCFSCKYSHKHITDERNMSEKPKIPLIENKDLIIYEIKTRGITKETCQKFKYSIYKNNNKYYQVANYYDSENNLVAQHVRDEEKHFTWKGDSKKISLFGQNIWSSGGKYISITEGEIDCLTLSQCFDNKYPVVSLPNGAQSAEKYIKQELKYLETFDTITLCFDDDEAGKQAISSVKKLISPGKLKIMTYNNHKDINELFLKEGKSSVISCFWNSKSYKPDFILQGDELLQELLKKPKVGIPYPYPLLQKETFGIRTKEILLCTAGSGIGKSTFTRELLMHLIKHSFHNIGCVYLEESPETTLRKLVGISLNQNIFLPNTVIDDEILTKTFNELNLKNRICLYNHFGSKDCDTLLNNLRYMIVSMNCKFIILDHISMVVSGLDEKSAGESERKTIDRLMTDLRTLCEELDVGFILVSHLKRNNTKQSFNEGGEVSLTDLRGSASIEQLSDIILSLERNQQCEKESNVSQIRILKNRAYGGTGKCDKLIYDNTTGRLTLYDNNNFFEICNDITLTDSPPF